MLNQFSNNNMLLLKLFNILGFTAVYNDMKNAYQ